MPRLASSLSALVLLAATVALAACGGSSGGGSSSGPSASAKAGTAQTASSDKFQQCLKDQGVQPRSRPQGGGTGNGYGPPPGAGNGQPPAGGPGAGGGGNSKFGKALQACAKYRPQGAGNGGRPGGQQNIQAFTPYLTCLEDQGLDVKVADGFNALRNLKRDDPKVQAAFKTCQPKLPQRPEGAPNGTAAPSATAAQS
jgi:hypothetical protein